MSRILIVDDDPDIRLALATILIEAGHETLEAPDGSGVLRAVLEHSPDLVLMDVLMPKMDGFEALSKLKRDRRTRDVPVVMITAKGRPDDLLTARSLGARDYIPKPWEKGEVELRVGWVLDGRTPAPR